MWYWRVEAARSWGALGGSVARTKDSATSRCLLVVSTALKHRITITKEINTIVHTRTTNCFMVRTQAKYSKCIYCSLVLHY